MNHPFTSGIDADKCHICKYDDIAHSDRAQCEACATIGPCDVLNNMLLCESCYAHDKQLEAIDSPTPSNDRETRITQLVNKLAKEIPNDRREYFVGRLTAIVDIEQQIKAEGIENPQYALARIVEQNLITLRDRLTNLHAQIREAQGNAVADQKYLNQIVPQLRAEEREKFKAYDISYKPTVVLPPTSGVSKPRMSAIDKAYESMAKQLGISVEQYKINLANAMKNVTGSVCSCAETPGMCRVHPK